MKLRRLTFSQLSEQSGSSISLDSPTLQRTQTIIDRVRQDRDTALYDYAREFNEIGLADQEPLSITRQQLESSLDRVDPNIRGTLERTAQRIESFAMRQLAAFQSLDCDIDGGYAGHRLIPISNVGCYVPGGRYPLVSTALMTAVTARVAGCQNVSLATPKPNETMLAAAAIANVDRVLRIGGGQGIAAMACGTQRIEPGGLIVG
ncbi:MAG TPA: histidinol dehydrogenase, partial [Pirellulaceae bacterium]|nr:histidinol dehydrogenase [Pirellulaceae bacterium]